MATTQLPADQYVIAGQPTLTGWQLPQAQYGLEEDADQHKDGAGRFACKITYSRRATLSVTLEAASGTTLTTYQTGGQIASGTFTDGAGNATAWKIRSAVLTKTRGPTQVALDLIAQTDLLA
jgi:hypothetical protein